MIKFLVGKEESFMGNFINEWGCSTEVLLSLFIVVGAMFFFYAVILKRKMIIMIVEALFSCAVMFGFLHWCGLI